MTNATAVERFNGKILWLFAVKSFESSNKLSLDPKINNDGNRWLSCIWMARKFILKVGHMNFDHLVWMDFF